MAKQYDYSEIFKSPEEAATMMDLGEGETLSLVRVEVLSCGKYKIVGGSVIQESVSFPDGTISEA